MSPTFDMEIMAMAAVDRELVQIGQRLEIAAGHGQAAATIGGFPLYDTDTRRPRT